MDSYNELELPEKSSETPPTAKKKKGCLFYGGIIFACIAVLLYILIEHGVLTYYKFHVTDESGKPLQGVVFYFKYDRNLNIGGKHDSGTRRIKLYTDEEGNASYFGFVKYRVRLLDMTFPGYYENRYCGIRNKTIVLREKKNPVPMYKSNGKLSKIMFPDYNGKFSFDLVKHDFLPPHGKGEVADFIFSLKSDIDSYKETKVFWDIIFPDEKDGIQIVYKSHRPINYSSFKGPYAAPEKGYLNSCRLAEKKFFENVSPNWHRLLPKQRKNILEMRQFGDFTENEPVYCFRVRSKSGTPLYGKIYCNQPCSGGGVCNGKFELYFEYYLNPDGTRNLEYSYNLFKIK